MGCGGSKGTAVVATTQATGHNAPATNPSPKPAAEVVKAGSIAEVEPTDSGYEETYITEKSKNVDADLLANRPATPDLAVEGKCMSVPPPTETAPDDGEVVVPIIMNRPSSRGGLAFDVTFSEVPKSQRLEMLQSRTQKSKPELTIQELQAKAAAAEQRKKEHEKRLTEKMAKESEKVSSAQRPAQSANEGEDRAAHFKTLSEQMKTKTDGGVSIRHSNEHLPAL